MYIFSRTTTLDRNRIAEATERAVEVAGIVTNITGLPIAVYVSRFGEPLNTIRWSTRLESQGELQDANDKLMANMDYLAWLGSNAEYYESAAADQLGYVVSSTMAEPKRFYTVLVAEAANGRFGDAVEFGVRAQQFVAQTTGFATAFLTGTYGAFGAVTWLTGVDSMNDLDTLQEMQMTNTDYHALVNEAGQLFRAGSGQGGLIEKIN